MSEHEPVSAALDGGTRLGLLRRRAREPLARTSLFTILTTVVTAGFGYLYWIVAARLVSTEVVGGTAASMTLVTGVALATNLGTCGYLMERLPGLEDTPLWRSTLSGALWPTVALSGLAALLVQGLVTFGISDVEHRLVIVLVGVVAAMGLTVANVLDAVFIASRRAPLATVLGGLLGVTKLASIALAWFIGPTPGTLIAAWALSILLSGAMAFRLVFPRLAHGRLPVEWRSLLPRRDVLSMVGHHITSLGGLMVPYLLPTLVVARLGAMEGGFFYTTWMMGSVFFMISPAIANSLFTEGARDLSQLAQSTRRAVVLLVVLLPVPIVVGIVEVSRCCRCSGRTTPATVPCCWPSSPLPPLRTPSPTSGSPSCGPAASCAVRRRSTWRSGSWRWAAPG